MNRKYGYDSVTIESVTAGLHSQLSSTYCSIYILHVYVGAKVNIDIHPKDHSAVIFPQWHIRHCS